MRLRAGISYLGAAMGPEDNPADDVEITKEDWEAMERAAEDAEEEQEDAEDQG